MKIVNIADGSLVLKNGETESDMQSNNLIVTAGFQNRIMALSPHADSDQAKNLFSINPSPVSNYFNLQNIPAFVSKIYFKVLDEKGNDLDSGVIFNTNGSGRSHNMENIDLSNGLYFILLQSASGFTRAIPFNIKNN